jgi:hypothetical protein
MKPRISFNNCTYRSGVLLVLVAGICWSSMGLGIRHIEDQQIPATSTSKTPLR